jgi:NitT/TauT family transport system ATP-binding protein
VTSPYISIRGVGKSYPAAKTDILALEDVNVDINVGEFISILGPSGCGKSTLLKCVAALEPITQGSIKIKGEEVRLPPENLGIVFQRDVLLDWRTVMDNVLITAELKGLDSKSFLPRAKELLALFGLTEYAHRYPWEMSGGMRQRASICRALLVDPELLLMDEPFGALDALTRDELNLEIRRMWNETKKTVLFVTHSIVEAVHLSTRIVVMAKNPGRIATIIDVDLPEDRPLSIRDSERFTRYVSEIRDMFSSLGIIKGA